MRANLERALNRVWYQPQRPPAGLRALVPLYRLIAARRWRQSPERPERPVIVVGNITVGGSGKTPLVLALARLLADAGISPAIISRGYGGAVHRLPSQVRPTSDPRRFGDEPVLLARRAACPVWVCRDRRA